MILMYIHLIVPNITHVMMSRLTRFKHENIKKIDINNESNSEIINLIEVIRSGIHKINSNKYDESHVDLSEIELTVFIKHKDLLTFMTRF